MNNYCAEPQAHPERCGCKPDAFQIARHSKRLVEQQRERIVALEAECAKLRGELALAMKVPSVAAMHTFLETEVAKQNVQLGAERDALRAELAAIKGQEVTQDLHFNSPDQLPPVDTPLLVLVDGEAVRARRPNFVERKGADLEFILVDGRTISGRMPWTYP